MFHNSKKKALYEVIIGARAKQVYEPVKPKFVEAQPVVRPSSPQVENTAPVSEPLPAAMNWLNKSRFVQLNAGRIEFSIPYQAGIAIALGVLLTLLLVFRLGEWFGSRIEANAAATVKQSVNKTEAESPKVIKQAPIVTTPAVAKATPRTESALPASVESAQPVVSTGKNRIVIQIHQSREQLEPVKAYFDGAGIATEIVERNNWYYLVSKNKYAGVDKSGSDGFQAKQKIIEIGAGYKAPAGFETFRKPGGTGPFSDAYGMKFVD